MTKECARNSQSDVRPLSALSVETNWLTTTHSEDSRRAGHWDEAARRCRLALDSIDTVLALEKERERVLQALVSSRKAMTKHDRALLVAATVRHYTHLSHHVDALGAPEEFSRHEAALISQT